MTSRGHSAYSSIHHVSVWDSVEPDQSPGQGTFTTGAPLTSNTWCYILVTAAGCDVLILA